MIELSVCIGSACYLNGSHNVVMSFRHLIEQYSLHDKINFSASFCMKKCNNQNVSIQLNGEKLRIPAESARSFFIDNVLPLTKE